jgi:hypothetical protein
MVIVGDIGAA